MNNFRRPRRVQRQTMDGFLQAPRPQANRRQIGDGAFRAAKLQPNTGRRLDNFDQPEGYNSNGIAGLGPTNRPSRPTITNGQASMLHMSMPGNTSFAPQKRTKKRKAHRIRKWVLATTLVLVLTVLITGGAIFAKGLLSAHKVLKGGGKAAALQANVNPNLLKGEGDGRINILLLGIGGDGHDGPDLTDTILIASIDPVNHKTALLSVPRDLWVSVPGAGSMKINAVYETGKYKYLGKMSDSNADAKAVEAGFALDDQILEQALGIPIHYHVLVNFHAFQQAVDTVGGVTVNVPTELYDPTMAWENHGSSILAEPGVQTFNGLQALYYARSRETSSDFARAERQRAIIVALEQKALSLGTVSDPLKISQLLDALGNNVVSDFSLTDMKRLYDITKGIDPATMQSVGLSNTPPNDLVTTGYIGNQSVVLPKAGLGDYSDIQSFVRNTLRDGYLAKENASVTVLNASSNTNLAQTQADTLKSYGYTVSTVGEAPIRHQHTVVVDLTHGKDSYTRHYLEERYGVKATTKLPDQAIHPGNAQFVIILGEDETTHS
jgi:LCP family protein required for cell wall assembly